jgi:hypothetical protein
MTHRARLNGMSEQPNDEPVFDTDLPSFDYGVDPSVRQITSEEAYVLYAKDRSARKWCNGAKFNIIPTTCDFLLFSRSVDLVSVITDPNFPKIMLSRKIRYVYKTNKQFKKDVDDFVKEVESNYWVRVYITKSGKYPILNFIYELKLGK